VLHFHPDSLDSFKRRDITYCVRCASPEDLDIALSVTKETGAIIPIASLLEQYIRIVANRPVAQNGFVALTMLTEDINPVASEAER